MLVFEERGKAEYQGQIEEFFIGGEGWGADHRIF